MRLVAVQYSACHCPEAVRGDVAGLVFHAAQGHDQGSRGNMFALAPAGRGNMNFPFPLKSWSRFMSSLTGQGNHMVESGLHPLGLDVPFGLFQVDFFPHAADQFTRAQHDIGRELQRQGYGVCLPPLR